MPSRQLTRHAVVAGSALALVTSFGATAMTGTASAASPKLVAASSTQTVRAIETEFHIALSRTTVHAGRVTITAVNKGKIKHGLIVDGPGQEDTLIGIVNPGHSATKTITLRKGKYDVYCPISHHKMAGMNTHLTVT
ncbi:MAG TPA: hypothetical protein VHW74_15540 [Mycobacteriales bacterium]|jgi:uncharacterized cupredoxin-like copper-binding protein|nr:hypothetical protein [Mycobacteriales bacterium]